MSRPSPFPGMDPYLEAHWGDVHHRLVMYSCDALQPNLPEDLRARVGERLVVESGAPDVVTTRRPIIPDVTIAAPAPWQDSGYGGGLATLPTTTTSAAFAVEPLVIEWTEVETTEGFIEIREARGEGRLVTAIEFLSPANKLPGGVGDGAAKYRQKQHEVLAARANLVEVDLVRAGRYVLAAPEERVPAEWRRDYLACVSLSTEVGHRRHELYPLSLRRPLPALPIPLRPGEARVSLDLSALLAHAYTAGRYDSLDYAAPLDPPLSPEDSAWAVARLTETRQA